MDDRCEASKGGLTQNKVESAAGAVAVAEGVVVTGGFPPYAGASVSTLAPPHNTFQRLDGAPTSGRPGGNDPIGNLAMQSPAFGSSAKERKFGGGEAPPPNFG